MTLWGYIHEGHDCKNNGCLPVFGSVVASLIAGSVIMVIIIKSGIAEKGYGGICLAIIIIAAVGVGIGVRSILDKIVEKKEEK